MGKKEQKDHHSTVESDDKVEAVLHLLRKHSPLTLNQEKFCNRACSPAVFFRRESHVSKIEKPRDTFVPFLKFYRRPYDEMTYRSKMRPPLGGLVSIVSTQIRRRHVSLSQRF
ncbi:hypothetical protein BRARA_J00360 [Brassica rapa]|uniref:Uncharacterized protein n=1 Tax=Brassica campestris TaxID=3711 RepID=A0A397XQN0_BRACM|nr:hypothetical protein BRARA_J00360 [Brassica rapa]